MALSARYLLVVVFVVDLNAAAEAQHGAASRADDKTLTTEPNLRQNIARTMAIEEGGVIQSGTRHHDSVLNGVLIGAGVGGLLGLIPDYFDDCEECHDSLYASIAVGAGIGLLVDLLRTDNRPVNPAVGYRPVNVSIARRGIRVQQIIRWD